MDQGCPFGTIITDATDECFGATDVFSYGVMLHTMFTRSEMWFDDEGRDPGTTTIKGVATQDMQKVARWYYDGMRPALDESPADMLASLGVVALVGSISSAAQTRTHDL